MTLPGRARPAPAPSRRHRRAAPCLVAALLAGLPVAALDLDLPPGARVAASTPAAAATHPLATGPFTAGAVPHRVASGQVAQTTWQIPAATAPAPGALAEALAAQLDAAGFALVFRCADRACGGFDFRHALPMGAAPEMFVDLGDYHYIAAERDGPDGPEHLALTISRGGETLYLHLAEIGPRAGGAVVTPSSRGATTPEAALPPRAAPAAPGSLGQRLLADGAATLDALRFESGASALSGSDYPVLAELAAFLAADPARRVVLVGHTDAEGSLPGNVALSEARAAAVRQHLIDRLGTDPAQVSAAGVGYLAPRATNTTAAGREANRRVEAVLVTAG